jgi:uncharacterized DUF497 family protein
MIRFEWDPPKAAANLKKHHVSFDEAKSVFYDEFAVQFFDEEHSSGEERANMARSFASFPLARQPSVKARFTKVARHES